MQISWMEKFVQKGTEITAPVPMAPSGTTGLGGFEVPSSKGDTLRSDASALNIGVLHLYQLWRYEPNTIDLQTPVNWSIGSLCCQSICQTLLIR
ncbi:Pantothenate kinase 2 [Vitis vinifera]|uniref:Pantothenate kinase 2 n=1 Tax=Vitis vinifera TaxID=29760 RepID=A0A438EZC8_VITVI|nr:Pantothenate kinase 2 [Vitis vinifera]